MIGNLKIVLVDDDRTTLAVVAALLEDRGHEVIQQESALGTSMIVLREKPDVVLLDVCMPGLSGDRLASLIATRAAGVKAPIVVLYSSLPDQELQAYASRTGVAGVIEKTGDHQAFMERFDAIVSAQLRGPGRPPPA